MRIPTILITNGGGSSSTTSQSISGDATSLEFIILKVEVNVDKDNPIETFTTNSGKLEFNYGNIKFPDILLSLYNVTITCSSYQSSLIYKATDVTQADNDITFGLGMVPIGNAYSDGKYYCDLSIKLQRIT
jgi:hypothetical protein